ncbi:hypothetical protein [Sporosarcina luteola]|uniref:hypothetical protein n=1 Tax=Sporosarcina luteola TaxID=582850 RepID=UPI0020414706|nr:hypothetical protein [Sporosarcina luteola]MCM3710529.1 hypothetical protein [Sporosarcina luteola]
MNLLWQTILIFIVVEASEATRYERGSSTAHFINPKWSDRKSKGGNRQYLH